MPWTRAKDCNFAHPNVRRWALLSPSPSFMIFKTRLTFVCCAILVGTALCATRSTHEMTEHTRTHTLTSLCNPNCFCNFVCAKLSANSAQTLSLVICHFATKKSSPQWRFHLWLCGWGMWLNNGDILQGVWCRIMFQTNCHWVVGPLHAK